MRVLYVSDSFGIHDDRFTTALLDRGHEVTIAVGTRGAWDIDGRPSTTLDFSIASVVQVGPLPLLADIDPPPDVPVVATCWGRDAFEPLAGKAQQILRSAATVICDCRVAAERLTDLGVDPQRIVSFPWGIDLTTFRPPVDRPADQEKRFVTTRAWTAFYRHELVLEAVAGLYARGEAITIDLYGSGPAEDALRRRTTELGLTAVVTFRPPVAERDLAKVLAEATAWVNAAPLDGVCISLLQAVACGCGVVTTDLACAREAAGPAEVGYFPTGDRAALLSLLASARRPDLAAVATGRRWLEAYADWAVNAVRYVDTVELR